MDNLKDYTDERLWNSIKLNYTSENYSGAILDGIQFIGDMIREKSGLASDGVNLIGASFGGKNPKIKLNRLSSESEQSIQKGTESVLRGVYSAFRNPRAHSKISDTQADAFEIIIFVNHLIRLIDKGKGKFSIEVILKRVFDKDFVRNKQYCDIIIGDIPKTKLLDVAIEIFRRKEEGRVHDLKLFWNRLKNHLGKGDIKEILGIALEELRFTTSLDTIYISVGLFSDQWQEIDEDSRLRVENKLIGLFEYSWENEYNHMSDEAAYARWYSKIIDLGSLRSEAAYQLYSMINSGNLNKQRFVIRHFGRFIEGLDGEDWVFSLDDILKDQLAAGSQIIYEYSTRVLSDERQKGIQEHIDSFTRSNHDNDGDDLPF